MQLNRLYNMDYRIGTKEFPDKFFDLAIVDPPYFEDYGKKIFPGAEISTTGVKRNRWESKYWSVPDQSYFDELKRISKNQIIWGINYYNCAFLGSGRIVWDKKNEKSSFSKCEIAYCSLHNKVEIFRYMWNGMLQENMKNKEIKIHPTQKPIQLYKWILRNYANPDMKIIDTHVGSGSSIIAFEDFGCDWIGFEIDKDYFDATIKRIDQHKLQYKLF